jgi:hypothetical protein
MDTIVHKIRLKPSSSPREFEAWVRETDYATCPDLRSVIEFGVHRVMESGASYEYFEVIRVSSRAAFEKDAASPVFQRLASEFERMAVVIDECGGTLISPGYRR